MPTITDCNLVMGHLSAENFLGGRMRLAAEKAWRTVEGKIAQPLGLGVEQAAEGIVRIIDVKMEEAIKAISTMRGHDLRDFMLLAFGGAGPVHAGRMARDLGMAGMIVPLYPGVYSAIGLIMSDVKHDYIQSKMTPIHELEPKDVNAMFARLEAMAAEELHEDGFAPASVAIQRALDMRYAGQGYEITMPCADTDLAALRRAFDAQHKLMFGHNAPEEVVEIVSYRVRGVGKVPPVAMPRFKPTGATLSDAFREKRHARFDGEAIECPVYQRERLDVDLTVKGPAILDQFDCTTVICPDQIARVDEWKNLIVTGKT
jgi:N-methylhydantoinase A